MVGKTNADPINGTLNHGGMSCIAGAGQDSRNDLTGCGG